MPDEKQPIPKTKGEAWALSESLKEPQQPSARDAEVTALQQRIRELEAERPTLSRFAQLIREAQQECYSEVAHKLTHELCKACGLPPSENWLYILKEVPKRLALGARVAAAYLAAAEAARNFNAKVFDGNTIPDVGEVIERLTPADATLALEQDRLLNRQDEFRDTVIMCTTFPLEQMKVLIKGRAADLEKQLADSKAKS